MKPSVNSHFKKNKLRLLLFGFFTAGVSFLAPLKSFQLKWLIDSRSKEEAFGYLGLVFAITFSSWLCERLSRRSFTKLAWYSAERSPSAPCPPPQVWQTLSLRPATRSPSAMPKSNLRAAFAPGWKPPCPAKPKLLTVHRLQRLTIWPARTSVSPIPVLPNLC